MWSQNGINRKSIIDLVRWNHLPLATHDPKVRTISGRVSAVCWAIWKTENKACISRIYLRLSIMIYMLVLLCCYATLNRSSLWASGEMQDMLLEGLYHVQAARNILVVTEDVSMTVVQKSVSRWLHETNLEDEDWAAVCAGCNRLIGVCVFWLIFSLVYVIMTFGSLLSALF